MDNRIIGQPEDETFVSQLCDLSTLYIDNPAGGFNPIVAFFVNGHLEKLQSKLEWAHTSVEPYAGGTSDGSPWHGVMDSDASETAIKEKFMSTMGSDDFEGDNLIKMTSELEVAPLWVL